MLKYTTDCCFNYKIKKSTNVNVNTGIYETGLVNAIKTGKKVNLLVFIFN